MVSVSPIGCSHGGLILHGVVCVCVLGWHGQDLPGWDMYGLSVSAVHCSGAYTGHACATEQPATHCNAAHATELLRSGCSAASE